MIADDGRLHGLDAVRATALLLGIVLHGAMSFVLPLPALDSSPSATLAALFYVIHVFRMSAFFFIAGFFARLVVERGGERAFVKDRARRIVIPLIGGWVVMMPMFVAILIWGVAKAYPAGVPPEVQAATPEGLPLTHLWFLYYLCIFYAVALLVRGALASTRIDAFFDRAVSAVGASWFGPLALALPLVLALLLDADWIPWAGIPTPDFGLAPKIPALVGFGFAFAFGWLVQRQASVLNVWRRRWLAYLIAAVVLTAAAYAMLGFPGVPNVADTAAMSVVPGPTYLRPLYAVCYAAAIWCWTFALIGAGLRFFPDPSPRWRYLADASYWMYLAHLPIVMALQVWVSQWPLHWTVKFPFVMAVTLALLLATYEYGVRSTWIGALLNGRRKPRGLPRDDVPHAAGTAPTA